MIVLPIVDRELRVAARRPATFRTRLWAALGAMALAAWKCLDFAWQGASSASQGESLFYTLSGLAFVYCLLIGARVTADSISEEKREGTLGLLFLTDLKGVDVVLGKLVASSLNSFYGLLAVLPLLAMPLLLGGVTLVHFGKMVLVLLVTLLFSLSIGIFVSAVSRNERKAMLATVLTVLSPAAVPFCIIFFLVAVLEKFPNPTPADVEFWLSCLLANPIYPFVFLLPITRPPFFTIPEWSFWLSLGIVFGLALFALGLTSLILPRLWRDRTRAGQPAQRLSLEERWRLLALGAPGKRRERSAWFLNRNAFFWLVSRDRLKPAYAWTFLASMVGVWIWGYFQHREVMFDFYPLVPTIILIHAFLKVWVVSEVSHRLVEDQRNGAMELLLSTPLTMEEIWRGQKLALFRQFAWPVLALCAIELVAFRTTLSLQVILPFLLVFLADLITLMWVGMRLSLAARSINQVILTSSLWILALPWVAYLVGWPMWRWVGRRLMWNFFHTPWRPNFEDKVFFWCAVSLIIDLVVVLCWARPQLRPRFPTSAAPSPNSSSQTFQKLLAWRLKSQV